MRPRPVRAPRQASFAFPEWGGARRGAGRKRVGDRPRLRHAARAEHTARYPVHVTLRVVRGVPSLRGGRTHRALCAALVAGSARAGFRLVEYSAQTNHVHLICEAQDRRSLACGVQGLCVRIARALNALWSRAGRLFDDRYHDRPLRTPREVRNALAYVLGNARRHGIHHLGGIDPCSSARWFDGWAVQLVAEAPAARPLARARTWLLTVGWRRWGLLQRLA